MKDSAAQGSTDPRVEELRRQLTNSPSDAGIYHSIGDLYLADNRPDQAADAYMHAAAFYTREGGSLKAIAIYKKILKLDSDRPDIYTLIGDLNSERGLSNNAIGDYLSAAKLYLKAGATKQALSLYRKITKVNPINTSVRLRVAELCLKEGETKEAVEEYLLVADAYEGQGRSANARELYEKVIEAQPGHAEARRRLGLAPLAVEESPLSESAVEEVSIELALPSDSPDAPQPQDASATIEFNPEGLDVEPLIVAEPPAGPEVTPSASPDEARRLLASGDIERAERIVRTLLLEDPDRSDYQAILGLVYLHKGDSSTAYEILYPIAQGWVEEGRYDAVRDAADAFLAIEPDQSDFLALRARVVGPSAESSGLSIEPIEVAEALEPDKDAAPPDLEIPETLPEVVPIMIEPAVEPAEAPVSFESQMEDAGSPPEALIQEPQSEAPQTPVSLELQTEEAKSTADRSIQEPQSDAPAVVEAPVAEPAEAAVPLDLQTREKAGSLTAPDEVASSTPVEPAAQQAAETLVDTTSFTSDMEEESSVIEVTISDEQAIEMGSSQSIDGEFEAILQEFREGITKQLGEEDYETHYDLGIAYKEMGLFDEAIEEFQKAACGTARFVDSSTLIAACYKARNLNKPAIACLEHALEDPRCVEAVAPYVQYDLALLYEEENMADKAMRLYARIPSIRDASERLTKLQAGASLSN